MAINENQKMILKMLIMYLVYFLYTYLAGYVISALKIQNSSFVMFAADFIFLLLIVWAYRKELRENFVELKKNFPLKRILKNVLLGILAVIGLKIVMGIVIELVNPNAAIDGNTSAILDLLKTAPYYAIFKTMIFASIAEELLFRKSLSAILKNNLVFIVVTSIIYTAMNFVFNTGAGLSLLDISMYFFTAVVFGYIYIKNERNIYIVMIVKFIMQFIPFIMLLLAQ